MKSKHPERLTIAAGQSQSRHLIARLVSGHLVSLPANMIAIVLLVSGAWPKAYAQVNSSGASQAGEAQSSLTPQTFTQDGISVEFSIVPIASRKSETPELLAGTEATVRFTIVDTGVGQPVTNLHPTAWIDRRESEQRPDAKQCREKVQSLLQPTLYQRPSIDLNSYFILALNNEPNISVIDPLSGFGGSKLYTLIPLRASGADWALSQDKKRLYVSMPSADGVAAIDTATWKVISNIDSGVNPTRIALQHDGRYLWVGNDGGEGGSGGVTVVDTQTLKVAAQLKIGSGHHEIAFAEDDSLAFVTNKQDGSLSVIDVRTLAKLTDIKVGPLPVAVVSSPLSKAIYVANEGDGTIVAIDEGRREILSRIKAEPGLCTVRINSDGRYGFAVNPATNRVYIFDVSSNRLIHSVPVGPDPDQIVFTGQFAYVRCLSSEYVTMIKISDLDKEPQVAVTSFPAGQRAPKESRASSVADAVVQAPGEDAVVVANPADKAIYYYTEGMATPMGSFLNYGRDPKSLLILDNSLSETARGVYTATVQLPVAGHYDVALLVSSPRLVNCFDITIADNPSLHTEAPIAIKVEPLIIDRNIRVGESYTLRFKVSDSQSKLPKNNLEDMGVLVFLAPGIWQQREVAKARGDGVYEMSFVPPKAGVYYVYFQCPSLRVPLNYITPLTLQAITR
jgi:YVTN family beta-propeller protein